jgi:hypothetical protein
VKRCAWLCLSIVKKRLRHGLPSLCKAGNGDDERT